MGLHRRTHPTPVASCFGCKAMSLTIDGRSPSKQTRMESAWDRDMPAFKRLVDQGYNPASIDGAAYLETHATTRFEIESGQGVVPDAGKLQDAINIFEDSTGQSVFTPSDQPTNVSAA